MNVKGFIIEDEQGKEFVMVCNQPYKKLGRTFSLRGWQRRRPVPPQQTERERRQIAGGALIALHDLLKRLPRCFDYEDDVSSNEGRHATPLRRTRKLRSLRQMT